MYSGASIAVVSAAVPPDNIEVATANLRGIPVLTRAEILGELVEAKFRNCSHRHSRQDHYVIYDRTCNDRGRLGVPRLSLVKKRKKCLWGVDAAKAKS